MGVVGLCCVVLCCAERKDGCSEVIGCRGESV
jgi:hypothetical protein